MEKWSEQAFFSEQRVVFFFEKKKKGRATKCAKDSN